MSKQGRAGRPPKIKNVREIVAQCLDEGRYTFSGHALGRFMQRDISQLEAVRILKMGKRDPRTDELVGLDWRYSFRNWIEQKEIRVCVAINPNGWIVITTAINLSGSREEE